MHNLYRVNARVCVCDMPALGDAKVCTVRARALEMHHMCGNVHRHIYSYMIYRQGLQRTSSIKVLGTQTIMHAILCSLMTNNAGACVRTWLVCEERSCEFVRVVCSCVCVCVCMGFRDVCGSSTGWPVGLRLAVWMHSFFPGQGVFGRFRRFARVVRGRCALWRCWWWWWHPTAYQNYIRYCVCVCVSVCLSRSARALAYTHHRGGTTYNTRAIYTRKGIRLRHLRDDDDTHFGARARVNC